MNKYKKLMKNTVIIAIGNFGSKFLVFFMMPIFTRFLTTSELGTANLLFQIPALLFPIITLSVNESVFRFIFDKGSDRRQILSIGLYITLIGNLIFAIITPILIFAGIDFFTENAVLLVLFSLTASIRFLIAHYCRARGLFKLFAIQGIFNTITTMSFNLLFIVALGLGAYGYVVGVLLGDLLTVIFIVLANRSWRFILPPSKVNKKVGKKMLRYSLPLTPTFFCWSILISSNLIFIRIFVGEDMTGLYTAANKIPTLLTIASGVFMQAWSFSAVSTQSPKERNRFFTKVYDYYQAIIFVAASGIIIFARVFATILFGPAFHEAWRFIPLLAMATVFFCLANFKVSVYMVQKNSKSPFFTVLYGAIVHVILSFVLIPESLLGISMVGLGGYGAAIAAIIGFGIVYITRAIDISKKVRYNQRIDKIFLSTLVIGAQVALSYFAPRWQVLGHISAILIMLAINATSLIEAGLYLHGKMKKKKKI